MRTRDNLRIGDCEIYYDLSDGNGEQFLGYTMGGITFTFEREWMDLVADEYGNAPLDMALTGQDLKIKAVLAEITTENVSRAIPEGSYAENGSDSKLGGGRKSGLLASSVEATLRLHPRRYEPDERNEDIYVWKAVSYDNVELNYKADEQRVLEVTFRALVDESQPDGQKLFRIGDADIS